VLFTAAIYLSLSIAVKGFNCGDQILVLRPKLVLICESPLRCPCPIQASHSTVFFLTRGQHSARSTSPRSTPGHQLTSVFITADVVTTIIQVVGAALIGVSESARARGESSPTTPKQANDILLAGLCVQVRFPPFFWTPYNSHLSSLSWNVLCPISTSRSGGDSLLPTKTTGNRHPLILDLLFRLFPLDPHHCHLPRRLNWLRFNVSKCRYQ